MEITVKHALESIYLNKRLAEVVIGIATKKNDAKPVVAASAVLLANIKFKDEIDKGEKLSEDEKEALVQTPKLVKKCNLSKGVVAALLKGGNPADIFGNSSEDDNPWK